MRLRPDAAADNGRSFCRWVAGAWLEGARAVWRRMWSTRGDQQKRWNGLHLTRARPQQVWDLQQEEVFV
jgi:hypothetical protein